MTKLRKCNKGYNCGLVCINKAFNCRQNTDASGAKIALDSYSNMLSRKIVSDKLSAGLDMAANELTLIGGDADVSSSTSQAKWFENGSGNNEIFHGKDIDFEVYSIELQEADLYIPSKINQKVKAYLDENSSGKAYYVLWGLSRQNERKQAHSDADKLKFALEAKKLWNLRIKSIFKSGDLLICDPDGGSNGARARAYARMGFGPAVEGQQSAVISSTGKLIPLQFGKVDNTGRSNEK